METSEEGSHAHSRGHWRTGRRRNFPQEKGKRKARKLVAWLSANPALGAGPLDDCPWSVFEQRTPRQRRQKPLFTGFLEHPVSQASVYYASLTGTRLLSGEPQNSPTPELWMKTFYEKGNESISANRQTAMTMLYRFSLSLSVGGNLANFRAVSDTRILVGGLGWRESTPSTGLDCAEGKSVAVVDPT